MKLRQNIGSTNTKADIPCEQYSQNTKVSKMNKYSAKNSISKQDEAMLKPVYIRALQFKA